MRLINADSIKFRPYYDDYVDYDGYINDLKTWQLDDILSDRVDNAPTVKAIPIEWIKNYASHKASKDLIDCYWHFWKDDVLKMVADWEEENEQAN